MVVEALYERIHLYQKDLDYPAKICQACIKCGRKECTPELAMETAMTGEKCPLAALRTHSRNLYIYLLFPKAELADIHHVICMNVNCDLVELYRYVKRYLYFKEHPNKVYRSRGL